MAGKALSKAAIPSALELDLLLPPSSSSSRSSAQLLPLLHLNFLNLHDPLAAHLFDLRNQRVAFIESGHVVAAAY